MPFVMGLFRKCIRKDPYHRVQATVKTQESGQGQGSACGHDQANICACRDSECDHSIALFKDRGRQNECSVLGGGQS